MRISRTLASKGFLDSVRSLVTKGWIGKIRSTASPVWPEPTYCDYPHAVKIATMGRLGAVVGTATRGHILRICIQEIPITITNPFGGSSWRRSRRDIYKKKIRVSIYAYGRTFVQEKIVDSDVNVKVEDIHVKELGNKKISIEIKDIKKDEKPI